MEPKYLPIGSVCTLKGKNKKVMIIGYYSVEFKGNLTIKDYCGCVYPEGMLLPESACNFNHTDIESVNFLGYKNEDQQKFEGLLNRLTGNVPDEEIAQKFHEDNDMFLTSNKSYSKLLFDENGVVMIADPVKIEKNHEQSNTFDNIKFDENGTVVSVDEDKEIENPFHKEYNNTTINEKSPLDSIFKNIQFDENGTVTSAEELDEKKNKSLAKIEFNDDGVVVSDGDHDEQQLNSNIQFDENGVVISDSSQSSTNKYEFNSDGVLISDGNKSYKDSLDNIKFDENGMVISANGKGLESDTLSNNYKFDENGIVVSTE